MMDLAPKGLRDADLGLLGTNKESLTALYQGLRDLELRLAEEGETLLAASPDDSSLAQRRRRLERLSDHLDLLDSQIQAAISYLDGQQELLWPTSQRELVQARIIEAQEGERRRLSREIHDGPAQILANAIFSLGYCGRLVDKDAAATKRELAHLEADLRDGLSEVRRLIFDLHLPSLGELGLEAALRQYILNYQARFDIAVQLDLGNLSERLSPTLEVTVFRVIQEALQNVQKHAAASLVTISCQRQTHYLAFVVADNGRGFDLQQLSARTTRHLGMVSMKERASLVKGRLQVESEPGKGTIVTFTIPYDGGQKGA